MSEAQSPTLQEPTTQSDSSELAVRSELSEIREFLDEETVQRITEMRGLSTAQVLKVMKYMITERRNADDLRLLLDVLEIANTDSAFNDPKKRELLEKAMTIYNFKAWLDGMGIPSQNATRQDLIQWWESYMEISKEFGFETAGHIDTGNVGLWKATRNLAAKMQKNPADYNFLPATLINNPGQVDRALQQINKPIPFVEVLTGEAWEDLIQSVKFISGFSSVDTEDDDEIRKSIWSIQLVINRKATKR